ncbi:ABC-2 type transporter [Caballeronia glebae]|uniref:ABC-2 type transporter n=1 Tax=Caballeronia glebae TaxID=1777143 RepID=A0A158D5H7_9BURK|nr:ABC transporter permease [Caballeronia glebae]SAK89771.1 ABC-2 type transporter [Caballeronia glebae]
MISHALGDFAKSITSWRLWMLLGWLEIRQRYARSRVGPFWLTISMGVVIGAIGVVYGTLFGQTMRDYLPFLAVSLVMWNFFAQTVQEGSVAYINSATYIRQAATSKMIFILMVVWRNLIVLAHNFLIVLLLFFVFGVSNWATLWLFIPAMVIYILNAFWLAMLAGLLSARFRDLPQIITALLQIAFYVTPIMYRPNALNRYEFIVEFNPLAYLVELVRGPLTGSVPSLLTWGVTAGMAVLGLIFALTLTGRYLKRIPYWV